MESKFKSNFKEIVHPIMIVLSTFAHPHVFPNLNNFLSLVGHKTKIFWYPTNFGYH